MLITYKTIAEFQTAVNQHQPKRIALDTETMNHAMFSIIDRYKIHPNQDLDPAWLWFEHVKQDAAGAEAFFRALASSQGIKVSEKWTKVAFNQCVRERGSKKHHLASGLDTRYASVYCLQLGFLDGDDVHVLVVQLGGEDELQMQEVVELLVFLDAAPRSWVIQNAAFDVPMLYSSLGVLLSRPIIDTKDMAGLWLGDRDDRSCSLEAMGQWLGLPSEYCKKEENPLLTNWRDTTDEHRLAYAINDIVAVLHIEQALRGLIKQEGLGQLYVLESAIAPRLCRTLIHGVRLDKSVLAEEIVALEQALSQAKQGFAFKGNLNAPATIKKWLEAVHGVSLATIEKKECSKDKAIVENVALWSDLNSIWEIRSQEKQLTLMRQRLKDGRVHARYYPIKSNQSGDGESQGGANTGRMSAKPAIQNIPKSKRHHYVADAGQVFICTDFNAIEYWVAAHMSQDATMLHLNHTKTDPHTYMASRLFDLPMEQIDKKSKERAIGKGANFQLIFGQYFTTFVSQLYASTGGAVDLTHEQGEEIVRKFFSIYTGLRAYLDAQVWAGAVNGYCQTLLGRRRYWKPSSFTRIYHRGGIYEGQFISDPQVLTRLHDRQWRNVCYNMPIQGTAADIYKLVIKEMPPWIRQCIHVHDQFVGAVPIERAEEGKQVVEETMMRCAKMLLPSVDVAVETDVSPYWI
jgi:DNA polymerase I